MFSELLNVFKAIRIYKRGKKKLVTLASDWMQ